MVDEKQKAFDWGSYVLSMRNKHPKSRLWRMRARQALRKLEELHGVVEDGILRRLPDKEQS